jgi:hypothetical protein
MKKSSFWNINAFFSSFSQSITVNTTSYTTEELVNEILINSPCVNATNVNFKSGIHWFLLIALDILQTPIPTFLLPAA